MAKWKHEFVSCALCRTISFEWIRAIWATHLLLLSLYTVGFSTRFVHSHSFTRTQLPYQMKNNWEMFQFNAVARDYRHGDGDISRFHVLQTKFVVGTRRKGKAKGYAVRCVWCFAIASTLRIELIPTIRIPMGAWSSSLKIISGTLSARNRKLDTLVGCASF